MLYARKNEKKCKNVYISLFNILVIRFNSQKYVTFAQNFEKTVQKYYKFLILTNKILKFMYFSLEFDGGYVVTLTQIWPDGSFQEKPLRKFLELGHALIFKEHDCLNLNEHQINYLVKRYDPNMLYRRISEHHFRLSGSNY